MTTFAPASAAETLEIVRWAAAEEQPLEIVGTGSKRGIGRPLQAEHVLDLSTLSGVTLYEPEELVLSARAGTPLAVIEEMLADRGQELAFEPIDCGPLFGAPRAAGTSGTIGGVLAANFSGPRRIKAGAARDHILGVHAVSGRGESFKAGGRVVKNVTGYDLSKAMAGSWGTLAVMTELTVKVLPAAETEETLAIRGLTDDEAIDAMAHAMGSSAEVSAAAHLPEGVAARVASNFLSSAPATLLRIEGFGPSVDYRSAMLRDLLGRGRKVDRLQRPASRGVWRDIRDVVPFSDEEGPVWRVSVAPDIAARLVLALRMQAAVDAFYDWQGGLVWLRLEADPEAELLRSLIRAHGGGHATLVRAPLAWRAAVPVFEPQPPALAALSARVKEQFDPKGILNPGRMLGGEAGTSG